MGKNKETPKKVLGPYTQREVDRMEEDRKRAFGGGGRTFNPKAVYDLAELLRRISKLVEKDTGKDWLPWMSDHAMMCLADAYYDGYMYPEALLRCSDEKLLENWKKMWDNYDNYLLEMIRNPYVEYDLKDQVVK